MSRGHDILNKTISLGDEPVETRYKIIKMLSKKEIEK